MSAENAWKVAREAAAKQAEAEGCDVRCEKCGALRSDHPYRHPFVGTFPPDTAAAIRSLPMPPAFRAAVEAETEELRGMLKAMLGMVDHPVMPHERSKYQQAAVNAARALLARLEAKGEGHE